MTLERQQQPSELERVSGSGSHCHLPVCGQGNRRNWRHILHSATSKAAFPRYIQDIAPTQRRTIEDYLSRIRAQLTRVLDGQGIPRPEAWIPTSRAVYTALTTIDIALEELRPRYMQGYGEVPPELATELEGISGELRGLVARLNRYLIEDAGQDLHQRLERLEQTSGEWNSWPKSNALSRSVGS